MRHLLVGVVLVAAVAAGPGSAGGSFQGGNGMILFDRHSSFDAAWSGWSLGAFNPDGSGGGVLVKESTNSVRGDWSPDGNKFVYRTCNDCSPSTANPQQLVVRNADGTGRTVVYDPAAGESAEAAAWSRDGTQIVYSVACISTCSNGHGLRVMNADGSGKQDVASPGVGAIDAVKSSSSGIVYSGWCTNGEWGLYLLPTGGGACQLIADSNANGGPQGADIDDNFDVSPDGTKVAYGLDYPTQAVNIWIVDLATNTKRQLTDFPAPPLGRIQGVYGGLSWSPDGTKIVFGYSDVTTETFSLEIIDVASGAITKLPDPVGPLLEDFHPSWQPCIGGVTKTCAAPQFVSAQTIAFGPLPGRTFGDPDFTVSATASSGLPVSFAASGSCTVSGSLVHLTGAGSCTITASQSGNASYSPAPSVQQTFSVAEAGQTISFAALSDRTYGDPDFAVSASASSGLSVSFSAAGSCTVVGSLVHLTGAGSCTITASQSGNAGYAAAPSVSQTFAVAKAGQTISFAALPDRKVGDLDFTVRATASSGLSVSFAASGDCSVGGSLVHVTGAGSCTITASQAGDANYARAASVSQTFAIAKSTSPARCVVPHLVGKTLAAAKTAIVRADCRIGRVSYAYSRTRRRGVVMSQKQRAGTVLAARAAVAVVVSRGVRR